MKMKKGLKTRALGLMAILTLATLLTAGCTRTDEHIAVHADGACSVAVAAYIEKDQYLQAMNFILGTFDEDTLTEDEFDAQMAELGYNLVTLDGEEYYNLVTETDTATELDSLTAFYTSSIALTVKDTVDYVRLTETSCEAGVSAMNLFSTLNTLSGGIVSTDTNALSDSAVLYNDAATEEYYAQLLEGSILYLSVSFDTEIANVSDNATLSDDKKTVTFSFPLDAKEDAKAYAYCVNDFSFDGVQTGTVYAEPVSYTIPDSLTATLNGISVSGDVTGTDGGVYTLLLKSEDGTQKTICYAIDLEAPAVTGLNKNKLCNFDSSIVISDDLSGIQSITVDGTDVMASYCVSDAVNGAATYNASTSYEYWVYALSEGTHTLEATDTAGHVTTVTFTYDETAPVIKGVKDGKTYKKAVTIKATDKNGIKSIKLNGTSIKSGKKLTKKGSYKLVVKDKAGNKTTVKFKIKK